MTLLVRKFEPTVWELPGPGSVKDDLQADVVADLKVQDNSVSFWACKNGKIDDVVLAIFFSRDKEAIPEALHLLLVPETTLREGDFELRKNESGGTCSIKSLNSLHHEVVGLTVRSLCALALRVSAYAPSHHETAIDSQGAIPSTGGYLLFTRPKLLRLFQAALGNGKIPHEVLANNKKFKRAMEEQSNPAAVDSCSPRRWGASTHQ